MNDQIKVYFVLIVQILLMSIILFEPLVTKVSIDYILFQPYFFLKLIFALVGFVILIIGFYNIRQNFTVLAKPKEEAGLTKNGIYKHVRNPIYLGVLLMSFAWASFFNSRIILFADILLVLLFIYKIKLEESFLRKKFGKEYDEYFGQTFCLIPYVW